MALEIERKFLVAENWQPEGNHHIIRQGYLPQRDDSPFTVRVRRTDDRAFLCIKGRNSGVTRAEYEYPIPSDEADELLTMLEKSGENLIDKTRYVIPCEGHTWEVDIFAGQNEGLRVAEIELTTEDEVFAKPEWIGEEVSGDPRYYNANLIDNPYCRWK